MYSHRKKTLQTELALFEFKHPFGTSLDPENRWVRLASLIPWDAFEDEYSSQIGVSGNDAYPVRMALGALIIKERLKVTDEETAAQIRENPYLRYFIGMQEYGTKQPFDPSLMVHFRSRISAEMLQRVNEQVCAPEDMRHPTDIGLLNDAREHSERVIVSLWATSNTGTERICGGVARTIYGCPARRSDARW
jgi:hypothetical protein